MRGWEDYAEDVVSLAMIKWQRMSADKQGVARLEQVIKTEAYSYLRSEGRTKDREQRAVNDRSSALNPRSRPHHEEDLIDLRETLAEASGSAEIPIDTHDVEIFELLTSGYPLADIARLTGFSRSQIKRSRERWRRLLGDLVFERSMTSSPVPKGPEG